MFRSPSVHEVQQDGAADAEPQTPRLKRLKIAARIRVSARKIWVSLPRSYPMQA